MPRHRIDLPARALDGVLTALIGLGAATVTRRPVVCGVISVGAAWLVAQGMDRAGYGYLAQLVETVVVAVALNILLARLWMRPQTVSAPPC